MFAVSGPLNGPVISTFNLSEFVNDLIATESFQTPATFDEEETFEEEDSEYLDLKHEAELEALFVTSEDSELIKTYWREHANAFRTTAELEDLFEEDYNATLSPAVEIGEFSLTALATPSVSTDFYIPEKAGSLCAGTFPQASLSLSLNSPQITHLENTQVLETTEATELFVNQRQLFTIPEEDILSDKSPAGGIGEFGSNALATPSVPPGLCTPERAGSLCAGILPQASVSIESQSDDYGNGGGPVKYVPGSARGSSGETPRSRRVRLHRKTSIEGPGWCGAESFVMDELLFKDAEPYLRAISAFGRGTKRKDGLELICLWRKVQDGISTVRPIPTTPAGMAKHNVSIKQSCSDGEYFNLDDHVRPELAETIRGLRPVG
ncbi:hypothetical protein BDR26DRAFT_900160 [Obelidium mucronatum]|nr:hypothetical protein BDR26DRAFT_900160 [Obelidium mucronatum]